MKSKSATMPPPGSGSTRETVLPGTTPDATVGDRRPLGTLLGSEDSATGEAKGGHFQSPTTHAQRYTHRTKPDKGGKSTHRPAENPPIGDLGGPFQAPHLQTVCRIFAPAISGVSASRQSTSRGNTPSDARSV